MKSYSIRILLFFSEIYFLHLLLIHRHDYVLIDKQLNLFNPGVSQSCELFLTTLHIYF